jgi:hypothetical protein
MAYNPNHGMRRALPLAVVGVLGASILAACEDDTAADTTYGAVQPPACERPLTSATSGTWGIIAFPEHLAALTHPEVSAADDAWWATAQEGAAAFIAAPENAGTAYGVQFELAYEQVPVGPVRMLADTLTHEASHRLSMPVYGTGVVYEGQDGMGMLTIIPLDTMKRPLSTAPACAV